MIYKLTLAVNRAFLCFQQHGIDGQKNYVSADKSTDLKWVSNSSDVTPQQLYQLVTQDRVKLVKKVNLELITEGSQGKLQHKLNLSDPDNLKEVRDRYFGRCYTIHASKEVAQYGIFIMHITL